MSSHRGLTFKLVGLILSSTTLVFFVAFAYNYHESKKALLKNVEESARNLAQSTVYKIETTLQAVQRLPCYLAATIENQPYTREEIERLLRNTVASNSEIFGAAIAFEPH
ncbi:MAG: serine/threonine protein phosphatase, partial [Deltaproteobacteria bacterium]|nr:serine/threonine protein phosphatase [Deltaproteobacteria bacterium]